eukprot:COSAG02_NODE_3137_length_7298_cov_48.676344_2_plen_94_part_00
MRCIPNARGRYLYHFTPVVYVVTQGLSTPMRAGRYFKIMKAGVGERKALCSLARHIDPRIMPRCDTKSILSQRVHVWTRCHNGMLANGAGILR